MFFISSYLSIFFFLFNSFLSTRQFSTRNTRLIQVNDLKPSIIRHSAVTSPLEIFDPSTVESLAGGREKIQELPTLTISIEEAYKRWAELNNLKPKKSGHKNFDLYNFLPYLVQEGKHMIIANNDDINENVSSEADIYVTHQELQRKWLLSSTAPFGKSIEQFSTEESLLQIYDPEDELILNNGRVLSEELPPTDIGKSVDLESSEIDQMEIYVTEEELSRVWTDFSGMTWGLPNNEFDIKDTLLLLDAANDEDDYYEVDFKNSPIRFLFSASDSSTDEWANEENQNQGLVVETTSLSSTSTSTQTSTSTPVLEHQPVVVSTEEVVEQPTTPKKRGRKPKVQPAPPPPPEQSVSAPVPSLEMDTEEDSTLIPPPPPPPPIPTSELMAYAGTAQVVRGVDEDGAEVDCLVASDGTVYRRVQYESAIEAKLRLDMTDLPIIKGSKTQRVREALKRLYLDLEDQTYNRKGWKKQRNSLSPDVETQSFMGDIMTGNTYMTPRIPANWDDPEAEGMPEAYLSTNTMAMPGEPETDFELKEYPWETLKLPIEKMVPAEIFNSIYWPPESLLREGKEIVSGKKVKVDGDGGTVDWNTFDFEQDAQKDAVEAAEEKDKLDVDSFFRSIDPSLGPGTGDEEEEGMLVEDVVTPILSDSLEVEKLGSTKIPAKPEDKPFVTPKEWLSKPQYKDYVGFEEWSKYDYVARDAYMYEDDLYMAVTMRHVLEVTDEYLHDHYEQTEAKHEFTFWQRFIERRLWGEDVSVEGMKDPIPPHMTPDIDRGITYSDEIIEMKGKIALLPALPPMPIRYENDSFGYNEDIKPLNIIGTVREQYDWTPSPNPENFEIDPDVVEKIAPVLQMANHLVKLKSTKDNKLIFDYLGPMRHIIGIRSMLLDIARNCLPEVEDLRLESVRMNDWSDAS